MEHKRMFDQEIDELKELIAGMGAAVQGIIQKAVDALEPQGAALADEVEQDGQKIDQMELMVNEQCVKLIALRQPEASDLRFLTTGIRIATDLERIGDLAEDIAYRARGLAGLPLLKPLVDIPKMAQLVQRAVAMVLEAFIRKDQYLAQRVWEIEGKVDELRDRVEVELIECMRREAKSVSRALPLLLVSRHLERICDHATNIAEDIVYMLEGKIVKHAG